jgi:hypothetical protein
VAVVVVVIVVKNKAVLVDQVVEHPTTTEVLSVALAIRQALLRLKEIMAALVMLAAAV